ncbi:hypothetical protein KFE25_005326 [Diacronema lutheri]|uniref:Uncharacterized protein n=1 Tax=Diacronema lutheri TaxID=2081491 RepID=A0A8J6CC62_DIALT|nr:hypothetical protein KFE25_005326 [Diacronema lutheri]
MAIALAAARGLPVHTRTLQLEATQQRRGRAGSPPRYPPTFPPNAAPSARAPHARALQLQLEPARRRGRSASPSRARPPSLAPSAACGGAGCSGAMGTAPPSAAGPPAALAPRPRAGSPGAARGADARARSLPLLPPPPSGAHAGAAEACTAWMRATEAVCSRALGRQVRFAPLAHAPPASAGVGADAPGGTCPGGELRVPYADGADAAELAQLMLTPALARAHLAGAAVEPSAAAGALVSRALALPAAITPAELAQRASILPPAERYRVLEGLAAQLQALTAALGARPPSNAPPCEPSAAARAAAAETRARAAAASASAHAAREDALSLGAFTLAFEAAVAEQADAVSRARELRDRLRAQRARLDGESDALAAAAAATEPVAAAAVSALRPRVRELHAAMAAHAAHLGALDGETAALAADNARLRGALALARARVDEHRQPIAQTLSHAREASLAERAASACCALAALDERASDARSANDAERSVNIRLRALRIADALRRRRSIASAQQQQHQHGQQQQQQQQQQHGHAQLDARAATRGARTLRRHPPSPQGVVVACAGAARGARTQRAPAPPPPPPPPPPPSRGACAGSAPPASPPPSRELVTQQLAGWAAELAWPAPAFGARAQPALAAAAGGAPSPARAVVPPSPPPRAAYSAVTAVTAASAAAAATAAATAAALDAALARAPDARSSPPARQVAAPPPPAAAERLTGAAEGGASVPVAPACVAASTRPTQHEMREARARAAVPRALPRALGRAERVSDAPVHELGSRSAPFSSDDGDADSDDGPSGHGLAHDGVGRGGSSDEAAADAPRRPNTAMRDGHFFWA